MGTHVRQGPGKGFRSDLGAFTMRKRLPDGSLEQLICTCRTCGRIYEYDRLRGHTKLECNSCRTNNRISRAALKQKLVDLRGGKCQLCGYRRCIDALAFHHVDPATKVFTLAMSNAQRSFASLVNEARKCVLLCENCHPEVHAGVRRIPPAIEAAIRRDLVPRKIRPSVRPATPIVVRNPV